MTLERRVTAAGTSGSPPPSALSAANRFETALLSRFISAGAVPLETASLTPAPYATAVPIPSLPTEVGTAELFRSVR